MSKQDGYLTVGEAAQLLSVTPATLRNWDKAGKLVPARHPVNGYRRYAAADIARMVKEEAAPYAASSPRETGAPSTATDSRAFRQIVRQMSAAYRNVEGGLLERFEEVTKLLHAKLWDELRPQQERRFRAGRDEAPQKVFDRVSSLYADSIDTSDPLATNGRKTLASYPEAVARCVNLLQDFSLLSIGSHAIGTAYEELIRNTFEKSENQQFFTPKNVVEFMVGALVLPPQATICDPASGSGGFLAQALNVADSPRLFAMEIDKRMAWVTQMNLALHGASNPHVRVQPGNGALDHQDSLRGFVPDGGFDVIVTNPPFGSDFQGPALREFELGGNRSSRRRGALFVERAISWLKPKTGRLAIVLDDGILNGAANTDVRNLMLRECEIEAIISLPEAAFKPYASVKTSVVILRRRARGDRRKNGPIFMAEAQQVGRKANGDPLYRRDTNGELQLDDDLQPILGTFRMLNRSASFTPKGGALMFLCGTEDFYRHIQHENRLDVPFHHPARAISEEALSKARYPLRRLTELVEVRNQSAVPCADDPTATWKFVGLAQIASRTGEYDVLEQSGDEMKSAVKRLNPMDVVFAKLRPELRKCFVVRDDHEELYASGECVVMYPRCKADQLFGEALDPHFLAITLRSDLVFGQLVYQITGTGRPRVSLSTLLSLRIPVPPINVQREIVATQRLAEQQVHEHRRRSEEELMRGEQALALAERHVQERLCGD